MKALVDGLAKDHTYPVPLWLSCRVLAAQVHCISTRYASSWLSWARPIPPPLKGVCILDLTHILAGPTATMLLTDLGQIM